MMIKLSNKLAKGLPDEPVVYCPGCDCLHVFNVNKANSITGAQWVWNGDADRPTFSPSLVVQFTKDGIPQRCHSFLREGVWNFLNDCTHKLAGKHVPLPDLPDYI